ncbi:hypothetical protein [Butyricicoccus porcorum]|uniref:hypothetical protein n=1 Tax=Butyricicoccus porcorum TaxID=1945634 RepID=UPI0013FDF598|nr:hypothetical protein [Butyricicoccus porcorum]MDD6986738.1 hypothetical protein [Butyricicoccus porcorum]MDY4483563.1 hypothetical protein [Butyricicoccus porcorum]
MKDLRSREKTGAWNVVWVLIVAGILNNVVSNLWFQIVVGSGTVRPTVFCICRSVAGRLLCL